MTTLSIRNLIEEKYRTIGFQKYARLVPENPESMPELVDIATAGEPEPFSRYASWLLFHVARENELLVQPYYNQILDSILVTHNPSVLRILIGVNLCLPLAEYKQGELLDLLMKIVADPDSKPGLVHYAVQRLVDFIALYPELRQEVMLSLELREEMGLNRGLITWTKAWLKKNKISK